jgi:hypothetical protein
MKDNIQTGPGCAYVGLLHPRTGGPPRAVWIVEEGPDGWLVEPVLGGGNPDIRAKAVFLPNSEWSRCALPDIDP